MATNNEQQSIIDSLKASFCRQHFPSLLQFLRDFDISEGNNYTPNDTLNMKILLQAYTHKEVANRLKTQINGETDEDFHKRRETEHNKDISRLKKACKWKLNDVKEEDVFLAIEEYFSITTETHYLNTLLEGLLGKISPLRNTAFLIDNARLKGFKKNYQFEDETTIKILNHFNIKTPKKTLGMQANQFRDFVCYPACIKKTEGDPDYVFLENAGKIIEEANFVNAFVLLANLRNWTSHEGASFLNNDDNALSFYRFIIYTHIGIVYVCRRIWRKYETKLVEKYDKPDIFDLQLEDIRLEVNIIENEKKHKIENCQITGGIILNKDSIENDYNVKFVVQAKRYQQISICFDCCNNSFKVPTMMNYYSWNPVLDIVVAPPNRQISYSFKGIAGDHADIEEQISKLFIEASENITIKSDKILKVLGELEPSLQSLRENIGNKNEEKHDEILKVLNSTKENICKKLDELNKNNSQNQKQIDNGLKTISSKIENINKSLNKDEEIDLSNNKKELLYYYPLLFGGIAILLYVFLFKIIDISNIDYSAFYVDNKCSIWAIVLVLLFIPGLYLHRKYFSTKYAALSKVSIKLMGFIPYIAIIIIMLVAWGWFIPNKGVGSLVANYDFAAKNHPDGDNAIAAELMDNYLKEEDPDNEQARIKLANYYLKYTGEVEKALQVSEPMFKDVKKYPNGVWAYAEVLYEMKDFNGVWTILDDYDKESSAIAEKLEGVMLSWGEGCTKDVHKGLNKLNSAYKKGNKDAMYQIGRFLVNDMTDWDTPGNSIDVADMDIIRGMYFLREFATQRPQAMIELGRLYEDLNMNDSAIFYYNRALHTAKDSLLVNETKYRLGLLAEKGIDSLKHYMTEAKLAKYPQAIIHSAIKEKDHKKLIAIYEKMGTYKGYRYISPIVFEYIATNQIDMALQTLRKEHPKAMFDECFVNGMALLLGSDYIKRDSLAGEELIRKSAANGCKYAQMMVLFAQLQQILENGNGIPMSKIDELELYGKRDSISFAYVLIANLMNRECFYDKAYHAAMKALSLGHPAGVIELKDDTGENPQWVQYKKSLDENRQKKLWFFRTKQIGLRNSLDSLKLRNITEGYFTDASLYNNVLSEWRLSFWSDVIIANPIPGMAFFPLNVWMTGDKNPQRDLYKRRLLDSAINNHEGAFREDERNLIVATLNNLADDNFRESLIKKYGDNPEIKAILESRDDRGFNPSNRNTYTITDGIMSLTHFDFESILTEISGVIGTDYFNNPFRE